MNAVEIGEAISALAEPVFLKKEKVMPREQVEALKRHLQDKFARIAAHALDSIDENNVSDSGFGELVRGQHLHIANVQEYCGRSY